MAIIFFRFPVEACSPVRPRGKRLRRRLVPGNFYRTSYVLLNLCNLYAYEECLKPKYENYKRLLEKKADELRRSMSAQKVSQMVSRQDHVLPTKATSANKVTKSGFS